MALRAGNTASATVNGTELPIVGWDNNPTAAIVTFINSKSGGHPVRLPTFTDGGAFTIDIDFDDANNAWAAPISLYPGLILTNVRLYVIGGPSASGGLTPTYWQYPEAIVTGNPTRVEVAGKIVSRILCIASGPFAPPGQSVQ